MTVPLPGVIVQEQLVLLPYMSGPSVRNPVNELSATLPLHGPVDVSMGCGTNTGIAGKGGEGNKPVGVGTLAEDAGGGVGGVTGSGVGDIVGDGVGDGVGDEVGDGVGTFVEGIGGSVGM